MKDIKKIAETSVAVPRLLHEQLGYPVRQGGRASGEAEEVRDEF
jgi:hypothetical protein